jgi:hypothetical protein
MNIEDKILAKIKDEKMKPRSIWFFLARDYSLWSLVLISILLASFSFAPLIFITQNFEPWHIKHLTNNPVSFILYTLPYTWIILCCVTTFLAIKAWENTKHGYKFDGKYVFICSVLASLILGIIFNLLDYGRTMENEFHILSFGKYKTFEERRDENWFSPEDGRLVGFVSGISTTSFLLSNNKNDFQINIYFDDSVPGSEYVNDQNKIRVIGFLNDGSQFIACSFFPDNLMPPKTHSPESNELRQARIEKMKNIFETYPECKEMFNNGLANFPHPRPGFKSNSEIKN